METLFKWIDFAIDVMKQVNLSSSSGNDRACLVSYSDITESGEGEISAGLLGFHWKSDLGVGRMECWRAYLLVAIVDWP